MQYPIIISNGSSHNRKDFLKNNIITRAIRSRAGRGALAQSIFTPLRRNLDYIGIARKVFVIEQLPDAALPFYENATKDI